MQARATLPETGFLRISQIVNQPARGNRPGRAGIIPVSAATWWAGCRAGRYPKPVKLSANVTAWRIEDIRSLIEAASAAPREAAHVASP